MRWYIKILIYIAFFAFTIYYFVQIADYISQLRMDMLFSGKLYEVFALTLIYMIFTKFVTALLQTGVFVAMKE